MWIVIYNDFLNHKNSLYWKGMHSLIVEKNQYCVVNGYIFYEFFTLGIVPYFHYTNNKVLRE